MSINRVTEIGRLTKDPELCKTPSGKSVVSFSLAVDRAYKQEGQQSADFIKFVAWDKKAEVICTYCKKGSQIGVEGHIVSSIREFNGIKIHNQDVHVDVIQLLDTRNQSNAQHQQEEYNETEYQAEPSPLEISPDDLPF